MSVDDILEAVYVLNPKTGDRARRLACAIGLLRQGTPRRECVRQIRDRFSTNRVEAWRIVDIAFDLAGQVTEQK